MEVEAFEITSEICGRTSGGRRLAAWVNWVRLLEILDALNLHYKIANHIDGFCGQKDGDLSATAAAMWMSSLSGMVKSSGVELSGKGAGVNGPGATVPQGTNHS